MLRSQFLVKGQWRSSVLVFHGIMDAHAYHSRWFNASLFSFPFSFLSFMTSQKTVRETQKLLSNTTTISTIRCVKRLVFHAVVELSYILLYTFCSSRSTNGTSNAFWRALGKTTNQEAAVCSRHRINCTSIAANGTSTRIRKDRPWLTPGVGASVRRGRRCFSSPRCAMVRAHFNWECIFQDETFQ